MAKSRKGACGKTMKKSRKGGCSKTKAKSGKGGYDNNTYFATSMKAQRFICKEMKGKNVKAVGGIQNALGGRLQDAGFDSASKLSCEVKKMTKRNFMRYMLKVLYYVRLYKLYRLGATRASQCFKAGTH